MSIPFPAYPAIIGLLFSVQVVAQEADTPAAIENKEFNPATLMWYETPAENWEEALPVGNGRLGAMVFGAYG